MSDDPSDYDNHAIRFASRNGHIEVVRLLLSDDRDNPSVNNKAGIRLASEAARLTNNASALM